VPAIESVTAPAASPVATPTSIAAPTSSPVPTSIVPALSLVAAVTASTSEASVASSVPALSSGVHSTSTVGSDTAFGPGLNFNFDFTFLEQPSFAHELPAEEAVLWLNTSNHDTNNWDFGGLGSTSTFVNAYSANSSATLAHTGSTLLSFNGNNEVFPAALVLPNVNMATTASTSSTSIFSVVTNTAGNKKRKRSGKDAGEK
jgi:hypothetical protein